MSAISPAPAGPKRPAGAFLCLDGRGRVRVDRLRRKFVTDLLAATPGGHLRRTAAPAYPRGCCSQPGPSCSCCPGRLPDDARQRSHWTTTAPGADFGRDCARLRLMVVVGITRGGGTRCMSTDCGGLWRQGSCVPAGAGHRGLALFAGFFIAALVANINHARSGTSGLSCWPPSRRRPAGRRWRRSRSFVIATGGGRGARP